MNWTSRAAALDAMDDWTPTSGAHPHWGQRYRNPEHPSLFCGASGGRYGCRSALAPDEPVYILPGHFVVCRECRDAYLRDTIVEQAALAALEQAASEPERVEFHTTPDVRS